MVKNTLFRKAVSAVSAAVAKIAPSETPRPRDPFYSDDERRAEVNARARGDWLGFRRRGWLRRGR